MLVRDTGDGVARGSVNLRENPDTAGTKAQP
jgi:hypothetical protein